jgi:hypothetical protein
MKITHNGRTYTRSGNDWYDEQNLKVNQQIAAELNRHYAHVPTPVAKPVARPEKRKRVNRKAGRSVEEEAIQLIIGPVIVDVIGRLQKKATAYVTREEIIAALLEDSEARHFLWEFYRRQTRANPFEWYVGNQVDWLGALMTKDVAGYDWPLERKKVGGKWAYRPRVSAR